MTNIYIPNSVEEILGTETFVNCTSLPEVKLPSSLTVIGDATFAGCTSITNITIPDNVVAIGILAFKNCTSLTSITFNGTMSQWNYIELGDGWNIGVPATFVQCSDGQVQL